MVTVVKNTDTPGYGYAKFGGSRMWIRKRIRKFLASVSDIRFRVQINKNWRIRANQNVYTRMRRYLCIYGYAEKLVYGYGYAIWRIFSQQLHYIYDEERPPSGIHLNQINKMSNVSLIYLRQPVAPTGLTDFHHGQYPGPQSKFPNLVQYVFYKQLFTFSGFLRCTQLFPVTPFFSIIHQKYV